MINEYVERSLSDNKINEVLKNKECVFSTPAEIAESCQPMAKIDVPQTISWADSQRDTSAWRGNPLQDSSLEMVYGLEKLVSRCNDKSLQHQWRKLLTSDHFYYMSTKNNEDGKVHKYFTPYEKPEDAYIVYSNVVNDLKEQLKNKKKIKHKIRELN